MNTEKDDIEVSIVMPCLNEEKTIGVCVEKAISVLRNNEISGEVIVADNGSVDDSIKIANSFGARVVHIEQKGYGNAYIGGISAAKGKLIVIADSDESYDFLDSKRFIEPLRKDYDMVMGTRLKGKIEKGAMPWLHRYIGNPILSRFLNVLFRTGISDAHCGMRSFTKEAFERMNLKMPGMEFASEMVIKASQIGLKIKEIPITLYPDGRSGDSHLRSFRDGWRHLRFMLIYSPTYLFLIPGTILFITGLVMLIALLKGPIFIGGHGFYLHFNVLGALSLILGYQIITLGLFAKVYALSFDYFLIDDFIYKFLKIFTLERGIYLGLILVGVGFLTNLYLLVKFLQTGGKNFFLIREALLAMGALLIGVQTIFSSFLIDLMLLKTKHNS